jgi:hypothetical protein
MSMFWIYDIPNWLFFIICNSFFVVTALLIFSITQKFILPKLRISEVSNDLLNYFIAAMGAFYSITLGLIAVGTWENFDATSKLADDEAASIAALYRDINYYPEPVATDLKAKLKEYTRYVIEVGWQQQQQGIVPTGGTERVDMFQKILYTFEPKSTKEELIHGEALSQFNHFITVRRSRLASVTDGLPNTLWVVIFTGAFMIIFLFSLFIDENRSLQRLLVGSLGIIIGTSIFLIAAMDYPFRGEFSVSPEAFELVYKGLMK